VAEETIACLKGMDLRVKIVHRGRGRGRRNVICTDLAVGRAQILRHLKQRWSVEVLFRILIQFGLGDCRCRGAKSLKRWVELVLLAYVLAGLTRWGKQLLREQPTWLEVRFYWGERLIRCDPEVGSWLAVLRRLVSWAFPFALSPLPQQSTAS
jgi:hypothetical protein